MAETNTTPINPYHLAVEQLLTGAFCGSATRFMATPFINWTLFKMESKQHFGPRDFFHRQSMNNALTYAASAVPCYSATFLANHGLNTIIPNEYACAFIAGSMAGISSTPFEFVGQYAQLNKLHTHDTVKAIYQQQGLRGFFRGGTAVAVREGFWSVSYNAVPKLTAPYGEVLGVHPLALKLTTAFAAGSLFGTLSTPLYRLRFQAQASTTPQTNYFKLMQHTWQQAPGVGLAKAHFFYRGALARSCTTGFVATSVVGISETITHVKTTPYNCG